MCTSLRSCLMDETLILNARAQEFSCALPQDFIFGDYAVAYVLLHHPLPSLRSVIVNSLLRSSLRCAWLITVLIFLIIYSLYRSARAHPSFTPFTMGHTFALCASVPLVTTFLGLTPNYSLSFTSTMKKHITIEITFMNKLTLKV